MEPIAGMLNGMKLLCLPCCWQFRAYAPSLAKVFGACMDVRCTECGVTIKKNREYGRKAAKELTQQPT